MKILLDFNLSSHSKEVDKVTTSADSAIKIPLLLKSTLALAFQFKTIKLYGIGPRFSSSPTAPRASAFTSAAPPVVTVAPPVYRSSFPNNQRAKRVPGQPNDVVDLDLILQQV